MRASRSNMSFETLLKAIISRRSPRRILEWGAGRSTWLMRELLPEAEIISIEHDRRWYKHWQMRLDVDLRLVPLGDRYSNPEVAGLFDLIFVDGRWRRRCLEAAARLVKTDRVVLLHDAQREWYHSAFERFAFQLWDEYDTVAFSHSPLDDIEAELHRRPGPDVAHIVMCTHGVRERFLKRTVPAVLETNGRFTLTIAANGSGKRARRYLESVRDDLFELIVYPKNIGKPKAVNAAWRLRVADYTVLLDDDALALEPGWLDELIAIARDCPDVGIVGHSLEPNEWPRRECGGHQVQLQPRNLGGACILVPRRTVKRCGYYNEELPLYGESDGLYGWKVRRAGLRCLYHDHTETGRRFEHIADGRDKKYRAKKTKLRQEAQEISARLREEYLAGRPLNQ